MSNLNSCPAQGHFYVGVTKYIYLQPVVLNVTNQTGIQSTRPMIVIEIGAYSRFHRLDSLGHNGDLVLLAYLLTLLYCNDCRLNSGESYCPTATSCGV